MQHRRPLPGDLVHVRMGQLCLEREVAGILTGRIFQQQQSAGFAHSLHRTDCPRPVRDAGDRGSDDRIALLFADERRSPSTSDSAR